MLEKIIVTPPTPTNLAGPAQPALWRLLDVLACCRQDFGLVPNSLGVLRALISFLPKSAQIGTSLIVWPSNQTLAGRADGMDERTLRRHLARLVKAGLIARCASANGKRFAIRHRNTVVAAYGFDLAPLLRMAEHLTERARSLRDDAEHLAALRTEILAHLHSLSTAGILVDDEAEIRKILRRRVGAEDLAEILTSLHKRLPEAQELTASNSQTVRQQQKTKEDSFLSVGTPIECNAQPEPREDAKKPLVDTTDITLQDCLNATTESRTFSNEPVRNWDDMLRLAERMAPMIGVGPELANHSRRAMGPLQAAVSILCLVQKAPLLHRPAAYLRRLTLLAETGQFSLKSLIRSAARTRFASANPGGAVWAGG